MTAAEDDEVVSIRDDLRPERFTASSEPPMLQEPVHVQVGQQRTDDTALRRAALTPFASSQAPCIVTGAWAPCDCHPKTTRSGEKSPFPPFTNDPRLIITHPFGMVDELARQLKM